MSSDDAVALDRRVFGTGPGVTWCARAMTAELLIVLHAGELDTAEIRQLVDVVRRESGHDLTGTRITTYPAPEPGELLAHALVLKHADDLGPDPLSRTSTYTIEAAGGRRVVAAVWAEEVSPWVRRTIPTHLARVETAGAAVTRRPGWTRLWSEAVVSFVACARDGDWRRFPDVHVVVSVLPEWRPRRVRKFMPGGYPAWADGVFARAGVRLDEVDGAHWLLCGHVVHLAYFSADPGVAPLVPWDLLTRAEKRGSVQRT